MELTKKRFGKICAIYSLVIVLVNIASLLIISSLVSYIDNEAREICYEFFENNRKLQLIINVINFSITGIPYWLYFVTVKEGDKEKLAARLINIPVLYSIFPAIGWLLGFALDIFIYHRIKSIYDIFVSEPLISNLFFSIGVIILLFTLCYFFLEAANRIIVLPRYFPEGNISMIKGVIKPSLLLVFIVMYLAISVFPIIIYTYNIIGIRLNNNLGLESREFIISGIFLVVFLAIILGLLALFRMPLRMLTKKASQIADGDYRVHKNTIVSNDEFGLLTDSFNAMAKSLQEKEFMRDTFGKAVDPKVRDYLLEKNVNLGGETRTVTVMFCDIRNFTSMSENMEPEKIVALLNRYFTALGKCITDNSGIINKYIGDAIMAIFGAPVETERHAFNAVNAALQMREELERLNKELKRDSLPELHFGIGIHTGKVLVGNIGAKDRIEYTVIGDAVNTSSRIESLCKVYKTDLLVSESSINASCNENDSIRSSCKFVADAEIRGKEERVRLYTI